MVWKVEFDPAAERDLDRLDPQVARRILKFLQDRIVKLDDPRSIGEALHGSKLGEFWKYRVGDYRLMLDSGWPPHRPGPPYRQPM